MMKQVISFYGFDVGRIASQKRGQYKDAGSGRADPKVTGILHSEKLIADLVAASETDGLIASPRSACGLPKDPRFLPSVVTMFGHLEPAEAFFSLIVSLGGEIHPSFQTKSFQPHETFESGQPYE